MTMVPVNIMVPQEMAPYITDTEFYVEPPEDYDWDEDKQDMSTYSQAMRYRDYIMERSQRW